jgi:hypothetical protein
VIAAGIAVLLVLLSLPSWLPAVVVAARMRIFARINGDEAISVPGELVDVSLFRRLYEHPAANGRSRGAALSDLFWYWLSPGPHVHQEHIEPGPRYDEVARTTRHILASGQARAERLAAECAQRVLTGLGSQRVSAVRLRDLMMPIWAEFYFELVFHERCPDYARTLIVDNADDVATALKCCGLRHLDRRERLTRFLLSKIELGEVPHRLPAGLSVPDQAFYLQGAFFNTAVVQSSEAMAHLLMALAGHEDVQARLAAGHDADYLDRVMEESLRRYPLFGVAHRITSADIEIGEGPVIRRGSVLCFNYPEFHRSGFDHPDRFDPDRWRELSTREANHIPFGVTGNRPCPARALAPIAMRAVVWELIRRFAVFSSASHTRSMPNRGPCLLVRRSDVDGVARPRARLAVMGVRDRWEDVWRSITQLVLGTYMVWDARRRKLCQRYFEDLDNNGAAARKSVH